MAERLRCISKASSWPNGFHELTDAREQQQRFEQDNRKRNARGLPQQPIDNNLLEALKAGLPGLFRRGAGRGSSGHAGAGAEQLGDVIAFTVDRA